MDIDYSVVIPVFNSEATLEPLSNQLIAFFTDRDYTFELIFVDDGSSDGSWRLLETIKEKAPDHTTIIRLDRNFGQHNATLCGFGFCKGEQVITIDDDLQNPPEEIAKLIEASRMHHSVVTYGIYKKKQHSMVRNMLSTTVKTSSRLFHNGAGKGSSFRLISSSIVDKINEHQMSFVFLDEIIHWYTDNIAFVEVEHRKRENNKSGYGPLRLFMLAANLTYVYSNIPLKLMIYSGFVISFISFLLGIKFILQKIFYDVPLGYTSVIVTILFSTSIIVFSLGVIGGYLSRVQTAQNKKPPYHIDKIR